MKNYFQNKKEKKLEDRLEEAYKRIGELIRGLDCKDPELRALIRDSANDFIKDTINV